MSGSYNDELARFRRGEVDRIDIEYTEYDSLNSYYHTGTVFRGETQFIQFETDNLWERMYVRPKPVIIVCGACKSHNAISNPTCVQCGAPMGWGKEVKYG